LLRGAGRAYICSPEAKICDHAIMATSMVSGATREGIWNKILAFHSDFARRALRVYGQIKDNPDRATDIYTEQCGGATPRANRGR
jgi:hypothetical protein